jgi:hypothetical protein
MACRLLKQKSEVDAGKIGMKTIITSLILTILLLGDAYCLEPLTGDLNNIKMANSRFPFSMWIPCFNDPDLPGVDTIFASIFFAYYTIIEAEDTISEYRFTYHKGIFRDDRFTVPKSDTPYIFLDSLIYEHIFCDHQRRIIYQPEICLRSEFDTLIINDTLGWLNIWIEDAAVEDKVGSLIYSLPLLSDSLMPGDPAILCLPPFQNLKTKSNMILRYQLVSSGKHEFSMDWIRLSNCTGRSLIDGAYDDIILRQYEENPELFKWKLGEVMYSQILPAEHLMLLILKAENQRRIIPARLFQLKEQDF